MMLQIKISITEEELTLLQERANKNLNSLSREARLILRHVLYNEIPTPASSDPIQPIQPTRIAGLEFPAFDYSHVTSSATVPQQSFANANTTAHTHADITLTLPKYTYTPDPNAGSIDVPAIDPSTVKDYTQSTTQPSNQTTPQPSKPEPKRVIGGPNDMPTPTAYKKPKSTVPVLTDLEVEQVDNEWDAEGYEYSTDEFLIDLNHLEDKLREDVPTHDPTLDPDYIALKNYFIKHDLRERFRSLLSDPSRFYPEEGVYEQPQIKYAQAAFRREKIDYDYIVALLSGTGADYRSTNKSKLYVDE